jgi:hypothetical protein
MNHFKDFSREELLKLIQVYAKYWLGGDGCFFLSGDAEFSELAEELNKSKRKQTAASEARRIMKAFKIPAHGGLPALKNALHYRLYTAINRQKIEWSNKHTLSLTMLECRLQKKRRERGLPDFPCKQFGLTGFQEFVKTVDPGIHVECEYCPPDKVGNSFCAWKFTINEKK